MFHLLIANVINLCINVLMSFLLPGFLDIDTFAVFKTYTLYIGYAGFFSLGFADGMYLEYGGKNLKEINYYKLGVNFKSYLALEFIVCFCIFIIGFLLKKWLVVAFSLGCFFINVIGYYSNLYQAVGAYHLYGQALNYQVFLSCVLNLLLIFFDVDNPVAFVSVQVSSSLIVMIYLTIAIDYRTGLLKFGKANFAEVKKNILAGFSLMLGNFSSSLFTTIDRWFVKFCFSTSVFAYYSFAVSLENLMSVFISPITISMYNIFCIEIDNSYLLKIKRLTIILGFFLLLVFFPIKFIVINWLPNYIDSLEIICFLLGAQSFYAVIKGVYINLYKAEKKQKRYFGVMICLIVISIILNLLFFFFIKSATAFALATFFTSFLWLLFCEYERKEIRYKITDYVFVLLSLLNYFISCMITNPIVGAFIYMFVFVCLIMLLMKQSLNDILFQIRSFTFKVKK